MEQPKLGGSVTTLAVQHGVTDSDSLEEVRRKVSAWLTATVPLSGPDIKSAAVQDWWGVYHRSGLATPTWPVEFGGLGLSNEAARVVSTEVVSRQAPVPYNLVTVMMIGAVLMTWGTAEQRARFLKPMATRSEVWCQMFSEPGAGSDLASLSTKAERDGDHWVVNGQKVWCSYAAEAGRGLALVRTDPSLPKHRGITALAIDMCSPGVTVRPLRQITGDSTFCEVFLDDVIVPDSDRVGEVNGGWTVAGTMLSAERSTLGGGGVSALARVGGVDLDTILEWLPGSSSDVRDEVIRAVIVDRVVQLLGARVQSEPQYEPVVKLMQGQHNQNLQELALKVYGPSSIAHLSDDVEARLIAWGFLRSRANTIAGGTSEVMRSLIGERILGLPRDPNPFNGKPWSEIPRS